MLSVMHRMHWAGKEVCGDKSAVRLRCNRAHKYTDTYILDDSQSVYFWDFDFLSETTHCEAIQEIAMDAEGTSTTHHPTA